jgi:CheY-like chemotaxis protein
LLDIIMPKMDGGELATQIEAGRELHDTPIIFLTALVTHVEERVDFISSEIRWSRSRSAFQS